MVSGTAASPAETRGGLSNLEGGYTLHMGYVCNALIP